MDKYIFELCILFNISSVPLFPKHLEAYVKYVLISVLYVLFWAVSLSDENLLTAFVLPLLLATYQHFFRCYKHSLDI